VEEVKKNCFQEIATVAQTLKFAASDTKKPSEETKFTAPTEQLTLSINTAYAKAKT
jgi:hypothetical protein